MLLSRPAILKHFEAGNIIIDPFKSKNVNTNSYDVCLGEYYFAEQDTQGSIPIFNPFSRKSVERIWGTFQRAKLLSELLDQLEIERLEGFEEYDKVILLGPGETILAHTQEFIGGRNCCTSEMKARSTLGRCFIEICKCAGMGDVGFINRWTMEITNNSRRRYIPLKIGMRVAQIKFYEVELLQNGDYSKSGGKYQDLDSLELLKKKWSPESMLPKLYKDKEFQPVVLERAKKGRKK